MHSNDWGTYLDPDERILWTGAPKPGYLVFRLVDIFLIPFVIIWMSVPTAMLFADGQETAMSIFSLFPLLFVIVGLYLLVGRFVLAGLKRGATRYAVSTKRAFIATNFLGKKLVEQPLDSSLRLSLKPGKLGSIVLGEVCSAFSNRGGWGVWTGDTGDFRFQRLADAEDVYQLIRKVQRGEA